MSEYEIVYKNYTMAFNKYDAIRDDYRARKINDDEYLKAREEFFKWHKKLDEALIEAEAIN